MFAFAVVAGVEQGATHQRDVASMLEAWEGVPSDGSDIQTSPRAAAGILRWEVVDRDRNVAPSWDSDQQLLIAGDVRLYNRPELAATFNRRHNDASTTDLEFARLAYLKWGHQAPRHLVGDFAFAVWDEKSATMFAARDHLGVRPLYYQGTGRTIRLTSDVQLLLSFLPRTMDSVDAYKVLEKFSRRPRLHGPTFFKGIRAVRPGHYLIASGERLAEQRYWYPPAVIGTSASYGESCEGFRSIFRRAVRDRLESDRPIVAHSSGGFDSSAILMVSNAIYRSETGRPPLVLASALTPGMPCDDSRYMDAVDRETSFEGIRWSALEPDLSDFHDPALAHPGTRRGMGGGPRREMALARERNARILLSGMGGDSICFASGVLRDLVRHGRLATALSETFGRLPPSVAIRHLLKAGLGVLRPHAALSALNGSGHRPGSPPSWMGPHLRAIYPYPPEDLDISNAPETSHLACELWARITSAQFAASVARMAAYGREEGIEVRMPFVDIRLVEHIFSVPWGDRIPRGDYRRLAKDSLGGLLPVEFAERTDQESWSPVFARAARRMLPTVRALIADGEWLAAPYLDRDETRRLLAQAENDSGLASTRTAVLVSEFGIFEAWLRRLFRYDAAQRGA